MQPLCVNSLMQRVKVKQGETILTLSFIHIWPKENLTFWLQLAKAEEKEEVGTCYIELLSSRFCFSQNQENICLPRQNSSLEKKKKEDPSFPVLKSGRAQCLYVYWKIWMWSWFIDAKYQRNNCWPKWIRTKVWILPTANYQFEWAW